MTMALCDNKTGNIYGYFGVPYPTTDAAIKLCFPDVDPWNDEVITSDHGEIWIEDLVLIPDSNYRLIHTNEVLTLEEIAEQYNKSHEESTMGLKESIANAYDDLMEITNNGILTDGINFFVQLEEGSASIPISSTEYKPLLKGTEEEFQKGIEGIDKDTTIWEMLLENLEMEEK